MRYGQIAGNHSINAMIYQCFELLSEADARVFVKKFNEQRKDVHQVMHTFRELLAGAFVAGQGFQPEYEPDIDGQTPDWRFLDRSGGRSFIMDVAGQIWSGWLKPKTERLYSSLGGKAAKYKNLVENHRCPYVISIHPLFAAYLTTDHIRDCTSPPDGIFPHYREVSGILVFEESGIPFSPARTAAYRFTYLANPFGANPLTISEGGIPVPFME